jgi:glutathione S-transferase
MILYFHPAAPNCFKVVVTAKLLGIALECQLVDLFKGEQREAGYLAINPNGIVPTLRDGEFVLWESNAIMQYLAGKQPAGKPPANMLWPVDEQVRADISRWQCWELAHWTPAVSTYLRENMFKRLKNLGAPDPAEIQKGDEKFHPLARVLDERLADQDYLVGNALTLADISVGAYLMYANQARVPIEPYRNIRRWVSKMNAIPAWGQSLPAMAA